MSWSWEHGFVSTELKPWANGYMHHDDPAEAIAWCGDCGEDYGPHDRHRCDPASVARHHGLDGAR